MEQEVQLPPPANDNTAQQAPGGLVASPQSLDYANFHIEGTAERIRIGLTTTPTSGTGIFMGNDGTGVYQFRVGDPVANYMHWDGTALTIIGRLSAIATKASTIFETAARFITAANGSGVVTFMNQGLHLSVGGTVSSDTLTEWITIISGNIFAANPVFSCIVYAQSLMTIDGKAFFGLGVPVSGTSTDFTIDHIGFKIIGNTLYATQGDGATEAASAALTTLTGGDVLDLILKVTSGTCVDYYWRKNAGALSTPTRLSTHMPSGTSIYAAFYASNNPSTTSGQDFRVGTASYER